jgi:hypothetical protein
MEGLMKRHSIVISTFAALLICASAVLPAVPYQFNFQGTLTDSSGNPITGIRNFQFHLFADSVGGSSLWNETHSGVQVENGIFQVSLGNSSPFPDDLFTGQILWLETVTQSEILLPRTKIISVPYSFKAAESDHATTADSAYVALTVAENSVGTVEIMDGSIDFMDIGDNQASAGQVIKWNGSQWIAADDSTAASAPGIQSIIPGDGIEVIPMSPEEVQVSVADNGITEEKLASQAVTTDKIAMGAVIAANIDSNTITAGQIASSTITAGQIAPSTITAGQIAPSTITSGQIAGRTITRAQIDSSTITKAEIANKTITRDQIADSTVTSAEIQDGTIDFDDIGQNSASVGQVIKWDGSGWSAADDERGGYGDITAVTAGAGLSGGGVSDSVTLNVNFGGGGLVDSVSRSDHNHDDTYVNEGQANSITTGMITDGQVGSDDLAEESVSNAKLDTNAVTTDKINPGSVENGDLGANAVTTEKIQDGTIQFDDIAQNGATAGQVMKWNGSAWTADSDSVGAGSGGGGGWQDDGDIIRLETSTDSVGIGTASPAEKLEVSGNLLTSGTITSGGIGRQNAIQIRGSESTITSEGPRLVVTTSTATPDAEIRVSSSNLVFTGDHITLGDSTNSAPGDNSTVTGGTNNQAGGDSSAIGGGCDNVANGSNSTIGGGSLNRTESRHAAIGGGLQNVAGDVGTPAEGSFATVGGGANNRAQGKRSVIAGGGGGYMSEGNEAYGEGSAIGGGSRNRAGDPSTPTGNYSTISGGYDNRAMEQYATVSGGTDNRAFDVGSTVGGGTQNMAQGPHSTISGGTDNQTYSEHTSIGGGMANIANQRGATVAGGSRNHAQGSYSVVCGGGGDMLADSNSATGDYSVVGGGRANIASGEQSAIVSGRYNYARGDYAVVCGGGGGTMPADSNSAIGDFSFVGGGKENSAGRYGGPVREGHYSVVCGGDHNEARDDYGVVAGGMSNHAMGQYAFVGGGNENNAAGDYSCVPGGSRNSAAAYGFAAGNQAQAQNNGCVVIAANSDPGWSDEVQSGGNEQMVLRADGGIYITNTSEIAPYNTSRMINTTTGAYLSSSGQWVDFCDRNSKENFTPIGGKELLAKIRELPITQWNYKVDDDQQRHIGPVAQDFYRLFGLGYNNTSISPMDLAGTALAAIQELLRTTHDQESEIAGLKAQNQLLLEQIQSFEKRIDVLEASRP